MLSEIVRCWKSIRRAPSRLVTFGVLALFGCVMLNWSFSLACRYFSNSPTYSWIFHSSRPLIGATVSQPWANRWSISKVNFVSDSLKLAVSSTSNHYQEWDSCCPRREWLVDVLRFVRRSSFGSSLWFFAPLCHCSFSPASLCDSPTYLILRP